MFAAVNCETMVSGSIVSLIQSRRLSQQREFLMLSVQAVLMMKR